jgi:type IV secretion system protein VirB6
MLFAEFWAWLQAQLALYVGTNTTFVARAVEPAAMILASIYVMGWGFMHFNGLIQEPIMDAAKRILIIIVVLGVGINLWAYNTVVVDTFFNAPRQLAASIVGAADPIATIDDIWDKGGYVASQLWNKGGIFNGDVGFYIAGGAIYLLMGAVCVYCMFLLALSEIAVSVILVLGPLFIVLLFFQSTKRFFESWMAALANYALVTPLAILVSVLLLQIVDSYARQTAARGSAILTVDALNMLLVSGLALLVLRQVPSMAAQLGSGVAISTFHAMSGIVNWGFGATKRTGYEFTRGAVDGLRGEPWSRWDSFRRGAGNVVGSGVGAVGDRVREPRRGGTMVPREEVMPPPSSFRN